MIIRRGDRVWFGSSQYWVQKTLFNPVTGHVVYISPRKKWCANMRNHVASLGGYICGEEDSHFNGGLVPMKAVRR